MKDYALFLGCMIPLRLPNLEASARKVLAALDFKISDIKGASCCPDPVGIQSLDYSTWLALAARNLSIAEDMGLDILALCNGCFETLKTVNETLRKDTKLRDKINSLLEELGRRFRGKIEVKHIVEVLYKEVGPQQIREHVVTDLSGLRVATHYGCHALRPSSILGVDDPEEPRFLDELVEATGARSVPYLKKLACCGATIRGIDKEQSLSFTSEKIEQATRSSADCLVVLCPTCFLQLDTGQIELKSTKKSDSNLPVLYLPELLGIAMGMNSDELGLSLHKIRVKSVLDRVS